MDMYTTLGYDNELLYYGSSYALAHLAGVDYVKEYADDDPTVVMQTLREFDKISCIDTNVFARIYS